MLIIFFLVSLIVTGVFIVFFIIELGDKNYISAILFAIASLAGLFAVIFIGYQLLEIAKMFLFCMLGDVYSCQKLGG